MIEIKNGQRRASHRQFFIKNAVQDGRDHLFFEFLKFYFGEINPQPMDQLWPARSSSKSLLNFWSRFWHFYFRLTEHPTYPNLDGWAVMMGWVYKPEAGKPMAPNTRVEIKQALTMVRLMLVSLPHLLRILEIFSSHF